MEASQIARRHHTAEFLVVEVRLAVIQLRIDELVAKLEMKFFQTVVLDRFVV